MRLLENWNVKPYGQFEFPLHWCTACNNIATRNSLRPCWQQWRSSKAIVIVPWFITKFRHFVFIYFFILFFQTSLWLCGLSRLFRLATIGWIFHFRGVLQQFLTRMVGVSTDTCRTVFAERWPHNGCLPKNTSPADTREKKHRPHVSLPRPLAYFIVPVALSSHID